MKQYRSLFRRFKSQPIDSVFAHFYPLNGDYDEPFRIIGRNTFDGYGVWAFHQPRFQKKYPFTDVPKLRNYLDYTFVRLLDLEESDPNKYFVFSSDQEWVCFNTGLQTPYGSDLLAGDVPISVEKCEAGIVGL